MDLGAVLAWMGAGLTVGLGLLGVLRPDVAAALVGIGAIGSRGTSEVRATYGGLFLGLGLAAFWLGPPGWLVRGLAWGGAALVRLLSLVVDRPFDGRNVGGVLLEGSIALLLLAHRLPG